MISLKEYIESQNNLHDKLFCQNRLNDKVFAFDAELEITALNKPQPYTGAE